MGYETKLTKKPDEVTYTSEVVEVGTPPDSDAVVITKIIARRTATVVLAIAGMIGIGFNIPASGWLIFLAFLIA